MEVSELHLLKKLQDKNHTRHCRRCYSTASQLVMLTESVGSQDCRNILKAEKASSITSFFGAKILKLQGNPKANPKGFIQWIGLFCSSLSTTMTDTSEQLVFPSDFNKFLYDNSFPSVNSKGKRTWSGSVYVSKAAWTALSNFFSPSLKRQDGVSDLSESKEELRSQGSCKKELTRRLCVNSKSFWFKETPAFCDQFASQSILC